MIKAIRERLAWHVVCMLGVIWNIWKKETLTRIRHTDTT